MKVKFVTAKQLTPKWQGMNYPAAKKLGFKGHIRPNEVWVLKTLPRREKQYTIRHELIERSLMQKHHMSYRKADKIANKLERRKKRR